MRFFFFNYFVGGALKRLINGKEKMIGKMRFEAKAKLSRNGESLHQRMSRKKV